MSSWNRRLSVAQQRPQAVAARARFSKEEVLREANERGVRADDQAALLALAKLATDREGFRTTIAVRTGEGDHELQFEVLHTPDGPVARMVGGARPTTTPPTQGDAEAGDDGIEIVPVLTDTLVETPDLVAVFASVGHEALWANDAFVTLIPIRESDKVWLVELLDEWSKGHYEVKVLPALVKYGRWRGRLTLLAGNDETLPVSAVIVAHRDHRGEIAAVSMVARDLGELRLAEERATASETRFAALVEHVSDLIAVLDTDGVIQYVSPATSHILGHDDGELDGKKLQELIHPDDLPASLLDLARPDEQGVGSPVELRLAAADGSWRYLELVVSDLTENPAIGGLVINARDVTERVEAVQSLAVKAFTDQLTGLPNRVRLLDRLGQALTESPDPGSVAIILVDLDRFKAVNEGFGQAVADGVVKVVGERLADVAGAGGDANGERDVTAARLRSDEFAIVVRDITDRATVTRLANKVREALTEPIKIDGNRVAVTASIGVAFSDAGDEPETLLRNADHAMVHAKDAGGDRTEVFSDDLAAKESRRRTVEQRLRAVIDSDEPLVHYQRIVDIESEAVVGAEALLRVADGEGELLSPAEFIEAAESSGLITKLGSQMLQATAAQLAAWSSELGDRAPRELSVNISPRQLADPDLPQHVLDAINAAGLEPERVCLEITENILITHHATVDASVSYLRALGVKIGLDEFGAGQSSLGYLKRFPLDFVKIDRTLVSGLGTDEQDTAIVRATVELAHNLGLVVVAVGVETDEQLDMLQLLGCDRAQGYLFSPPLPPDEFARQPQRAS